MSIKYEIHSIKNSQGTGKDRHFAQIFDQPAMTAEKPHPGQLFADKRRRGSHAVGSARAHDKGAD